MSSPMEKGLRKMYNVFMKLVSFNVNGIRSILKKDFEKTFSSLDADIFFIEESKYTPDEKNSFPFEKEEYELYHRESQLRKGYSGVAAYTKKRPLSVHYGLKDNKYDEEGRVITLEFEDFYFVGAYVPNSGEELKRLSFRQEYEKDLVEYLVELDKKKPVIYTGDLNVAHNEIDLKNPSTNHHNAGFTDEEREMFTNLLSKGFIDTFRKLYPDKVEYSWWSYRFHAREKNAGWRIDYFLVSERLFGKVKDSKIHTEIFGSDHCPVELDIDL